jgi:hypothetical protein
MVHNRNKPGHTKKSYYVPQRVITSIPLYREKLILQLLSMDDEDDEPVIVDEVKRDQKSLGKALRFLATGYLAPLDASSTTTFNTIDKFTVLYDFSINLDIEDLEQAVLGRINNILLRRSWRGILPHLSRPLDQAQAVLPVAASRADYHCRSAQP